MTDDPSTGIGDALRQARALLDAGRPEDAVAALQAVFRAEPDNADAHHLAGVALLRVGRAAAALSHLERAAAGAPRVVDHHVNLGVALEKSGRLDDAVAAYERALALDPASAAANANLGFALRRRGDFAAALACFGRALDHDPDLISAQLAFAHLLGGLRAPGPDDRIKGWLLRALNMAHCDHGALAPAVAHQLELTFGLTAGAEGNHDGGAIDGAAIAAAEPLFSAYLETCVNRSIPLERLLTALRRRLLLAVDGGATLAAEDEASAAALALQGFINEHVFFAEDDERAALGRLKANVEGALATGAAGAAGATAAAIAASLTVFAMYAPLAEIAGAGRLADAAPDVLGPGLNRLVGLGLRDAAHENRLKSSIPALGTISDETSRAVRAQYEEHPYPRWLTAPGQQPARIEATLAGMFPGAVADADAAGAGPDVGRPPDLLIAGCGTGQHVHQVAGTHPDARILAVDLSLASIAYAMRMLGERGFDNVEFLHADILALGQPGALGAPDRRFDMIQSVGVLHHMAEPLTGWRVLAGLLKPGGVMKVGLYSARGRAGVRICRGIIADEGIAAEPAGIRAFRRRLLDDPPTGIERVLETADFFTTSMCRDLLFHVQESHYTPKGLKAEMADLGLRFLGFEGFDDAGINDAYRDAHPDDPALTDLERWETFEAANGELTDMYLAWCLKPKA